MPEAIIAQTLREFAWHNYALEPPTGPDAEWIDALAGEIWHALFSHPDAPWANEIRRSVLFGD